MIDNFSTEIAIDNQFGAIYSTQLFDDSLLSCASSKTGQVAARFFDDGQCVFAAIEGRGSDDLAFQVQTDSENYWSVQPALEVGAEFATADGIRLRPHLTVGLTQFLNHPEPSLSARFANAPLDAPGFVNAKKIDTTRLDIIGGLEVFAQEQLVLRANGFTSLSNNDSIYGGSLRVEVAF